jgi:hypothetical protein
MNTCLLRKLVAEVESMLSFPLVLELSSQGLPVHAGREER